MIDFEILRRFSATYAFCNIWLSMVIVFLRVPLVGRLASAGFRFYLRIISQSLLTTAMLFNIPQSVIRNTSG